MAIDYYNNLTPEERLDKVGELLIKDIYLYCQKNNDEIKKSSEEKQVPIPKAERREGVNLVPAINLNERILTIKETIEFLRISRTTLWRLRRQRKIPYCRISNKLVRFKQSEILNCIATKNSLDRKI